MRKNDSDEIFFRKCSTIVMMVGLRGQEPRGTPNLLENHEGWKRPVRETRSYFICFSCEQIPYVVQTGEQFLYVA